MDVKELSDALNTVFEIEIQDLDKGTKTFNVIDNADETIEYPHAETLVQLYANIRNSERLKALFLDTLERGVVNAESSFFVTYRLYTGISPLCFYTLIRAGYVNEAIAFLKKRKKSCEGLFNIILYMLPLNCFDSAQLGDILLKAKEMTRKVDWYDRESNKGLKLVDILVDLRFAFLQRKINSINIEINQDKRILAEKIYRYGFDKRYNELLDGIDKFINSETEQFINAGLISNLRSFIEDLLKDIALRIAEKNQEEIPKLPDHKEMGNVRKYLQQKLDYSGKDDRFVTAFVDILHSEGGHSFTSEKEYFRLARNIAIEITLFVLSKYERKYA
ncbi:MAG: hypothetical protein ACQCN5_03845 [Candidatus Bathyarchaeia archaeon]|jgi:hypothetical protein